MQIEPTYGKRAANEFPSLYTPAPSPQSEPPRLFRRLLHLRGWILEEVTRKHRLQLRRGSRREDPEQVQRQIGGNRPCLFDAVHDGGRSLEGLEATRTNGVLQCRGMNENVRQIVGVMLD